MPDGNVPVPKNTWLLFIAVGRQRVGKTTLLNALVQYVHAHGVRLVALNADQQNRTHSLSTFFPDALTPPPGGLTDQTVWIEERLTDQVAKGYHAVLDAGGGFTGFSLLLESVPVMEAVEARGVLPVSLFVTGPEQADLDYLNHFAERGLFLPKSSLIVLNDGLIVTGRSPELAFAPVLESKVVQNAVVRGARIVRMPALSCMSQVTDRGLTFAEAAEGRVKPGQPEMSFFDPIRVREWWTKKMPIFFSQFPPEWLPSANPVASREAALSGGTA